MGRIILAKVGGDLLIKIDLVAVVFVILVDVTWQIKLKGTSGSMPFLY